MIKSLLFACLIIVAAANEFEGFVQVPGGTLIHKSCIVSVPHGFVVEGEALGDTILRNPTTGEQKVIPACKHIAPSQPNQQVYAMDVHYVATPTLMANMNTSFNAPALPSQNAGQVVYFWPGFKSTDPTMGLPVLQPVLQFGTDSEGGGNYWCVRSWFVYGNAGIAYVSPEVAVKEADNIDSWMSYDSPSQMWTIYSYNTNSKQTTTLTVSRAKTQNTDFHVAMLVLETIMSPNNCKLLPAAPGNEITFSGILVNGVIPPWTQRVTLHDCNDTISVGADNTVKFTWA
jgi:hypothetical protein